MKFHTRAWTRWLLTLLGLAFVVFWIRSGSSDSDEEEVERWKLSPLWVEDQKPHLNPHKFEYLVNEPNFCYEKVSWYKK